MIKINEESRLRFGSKIGSTVKSVGQYSFLTRIGLTKMANVIVKTTESESRDFGFLSIGLIFGHPIHRFKAT